MMDKSFDLVDLLPFIVVPLDTNGEITFLASCPSYPTIFAFNKNSDVALNDVRELITDPLLDELLV